MKHFTYQLISVYMTHDKIISEIVKNYVTSSSNIEINNLYDLTSKFSNSTEFTKHQIVFTW